MYRDETAAYRQRWATAKQDAQAAWAEIGQQLDAMRVLNEQLAERKRDGIALPEIEPLRVRAEPSRSCAAAELLVRCGDIEREAERLRAEVATLRHVNHVLNDRVQGKHANLPLGPPPRSVPATYLFAEWLGTRPMVLVFATVMGVPAVIGVAAADSWIAALVTALLVALVGGLFVLARARKGFLERCVVAEGIRVLGSESTSSSYKNWNLPVARGWKVTHEGYTGSGIRTKVGFVLEDGSEGTVKISGRPYERGVILHDPLTRRARCVSQLRCAPHPDARGHWQAGLSVGLWIRIVITTLVLLAALFSSVSFWLPGV